MVKSLGLFDVEDRLAYSSGLRDPLEAFSRRGSACHFWICGARETCFHATTKNVHQCRMIFAL